MSDVLQDENKKGSMARRLLLGVIPADFVFVYLVVLLQLIPPIEVWAFMSGITLALIGWAGGPRITSHLKDLVKR